MSSYNAQYRRRGNPNNRFLVCGASLAVFWVDLFVGTRDAPLCVSALTMHIDLFVRSLVLQNRGASVLSVCCTCPNEL